MDESLFLRNPYLVSANDPNQPTQAEFDAWDKIHGNLRPENPILNQKDKLIAEHR